MTYQPVVPLSGFAGWSFLSRTLETQQAAFDSSAVVQRNVDYFKENIGNVSTAEELMADRRLREVALGAFGLGEDINNIFFIQTILEEGVIDPDSLANKLSDNRYEAMSEAFGFGDFPVPNTAKSDFGDQITELYQQREFEVAVGNIDENLRLALSLDRELGEILAEDTTDDGRWFLVMGDPPLRTVFETALGLPSSFGTLDLDLQLSGFRDKALSRFGSAEVSQFNDPEKREELIRTFLVQAEIQNITTNLSGSNAALTLLQNAAVTQSSLFG